MNVKRYVLVISLAMLSSAHMVSAALEPPRNPDSAKECAICHYRWVDTFFIDGRGSDLVAFQSEKVVATPEMCFSCHDGSVVDSRAKVYNDHRHRINRPPPEDMKIPRLFPLDSSGNMQCFTCHTAHGVPSEMGIEKTIFLRTSNLNSGMCILCHADKDGGTATGNHPIGPSEQPIPKALISHGSQQGSERNQIICETCHTVHGSPYESFLIESARNSMLCLECYRDKNIFTPEGTRNHFHVINVKPVRVEIPADVLKRGAKLGFNGEIICQTCHKVHNNRYEKKLLLIMRDEKSSLCLTCHKDKQYLADTKHNLEHSSPEEKNLDGKTVAEEGVCSACHLPHKEARKTAEKGDFISRLCLSCHSQKNIAEKAIPAEYRHPLDISPFSTDKPDIALATRGIDTEKLSLPLYNASGTQDREGIITCTTCHDPHRWRPDSEKGETRKDVQGDRMSSFLRKSAPDICRECHGAKFTIENSKHDINKVAPDKKNILSQTPAESGLCGVCHLVHGGQQRYLWAREITTGSGNSVQDLCAGCHNGKGMAEKKVIHEYSHPVNIAPGEKGHPTTLPLFDETGRVSGTGLMTCPTCHDPHRWDPVNIIQDEHYKTEGNGRNSFLRLAYIPSPILCENCHPVEAMIAKTDHDIAMMCPETTNSAGQTPAESGTCGVCHLMHNSKNRIRLWAREFGKGASLMDRMCNSCHSPGGMAKDKIPPIVTHPEGELITNVGRDNMGKSNYFPLFDRHSGEYVRVGNISCPSCHNVHQWDPRFAVKGSGRNMEGTATNSFLRAQTYSLICIECHGLDALFRFKYYHNPKDRVETLRKLIIPELTR